MAVGKDGIDMFEFENDAFANGCDFVAGVDEVGRGPLAGEVVCCAVIMPKGSAILGVNDSKKLSAKKREMLYDIIIKEAVAVAIEEVDCKVIDEINILNATKLCMKNAVLKLCQKPDVVLVDAIKLDIPYKTIGIIKGDAKSYTIACASIVAKVFRDRKMDEYAKIYPQYSFEKNKGYGTAVHIKALQDFGATPIHRRSFIKNFIKKSKS